MASISISCPYCRTERAAFTGGTYVLRRPGEHVFNLFMQCGICGECVVAQFADIHFGLWLAGRSAQITPPVVYPAEPKNKTPDHLPESVARFFEQGIDAFGRNNWDSAGTMFRKTLDVGLKRLDPSIQGSLQKRIDGLSSASGVTPAMKAWAHQIRRLGNDAAHDDEPFLAEEAKDLSDFTELFLTYAFTLPGMLARRQGADKEQCG